MRRMIATALLAACFLHGRMPDARADSMIAAIREAGTLGCAVVTDQDDYSEADTHGNLAALGTQYCRAMAAEIFGDAARAKIIALPDEPTALRAVRDRKADILFGATPNPVIGGVYDVGFGPPIFLDGQGFLVAKASGIDGLADLSGRSVCFINASPPEQILYDALEPLLEKPELRFPYSERGEMAAALVGGHCDAITGDISWLANMRSAFHAQVSRFTILPATISFDPFSPAFRAGDHEFASLVDWTVWVMLAAEMHGVTRANAVAMREESADPVVRRLTGAMPWIGKALGVSDDAFLHAIMAVGNAGEIYDRAVGLGSPLQIARGRNAPVSQGGMMWALPIAPLQ